jgi:2-dehydro-3-deoxyphosphogalactonate aldolase
MKAVLPRGLPLLVVGGIMPESMAMWKAAGADGFGLGSNLFKPGTTAAICGERAAGYIAAVRAAEAQ